MRLRARETDDGADEEEGRGSERYLEDGDLGDFG